MVGGNGGEVARAGGHLIQAQPGSVHRDALDDMAFLDRPCHRLRGAGGHRHGVGGLHAFGNAIGVHSDGVVALGGVGGDERDLCQGDHHRMVSRKVRELIAAALGIHAAAVHLDAGDVSILARSPHHGGRGALHHIGARADGGASGNAAQLRGDGVGNHRLVHHVGVGDAVIVCVDVYLRFWRVGRIDLSGIHRLGLAIPPHSRSPGWRPGS